MANNGITMNLAGSGLTIENIQQFYRTISRDPAVDRVLNEELARDYRSAFDPYFLNMCLRIRAYYKDTLNVLMEQYHLQDIEKVTRLDHGQEEEPLIWNKPMLKEKLTLQGAIFMMTGLYAYRDPTRGATDAESWAKVPDINTNYLIKSTSFDDAVMNYKKLSTDANTSASTAAAWQTWMHDKYKGEERLQVY